jgi:hypothetical protein
MLAQTSARLGLDLERILQRAQRVAQLEQKALPLLCSAAFGASSH